MIQQKETIMNYKSLNEAIRSVTNPQPKNEALTSLQENIDLYNAVLPYTIGLQSVIVLAMIEALLDGSGPISGTVSLFKNLMKKWKARVLGGKLSADEAQSFIAEYEKLSASLPTGKRNFLKASFNKMEQAAKAGDKGKLGAIATEVKDYLARNSATVKEDIQTPQRKAEGEKDIKNLTGTYKRRIKKMAGIPNPHVPSNAADIAGDRAHDALTNLTNRIAKHETERRSTELYGHRGKIIKKKATVKEDYQTRERDRQMANTGQLGSSLDSKEKASKKVYGKDGVVAHKSLRSMIKKANWKGLENEKNRLAQRFADPNKTSSFENRSATVKEEQEYIAMLESALESIAEELECSVEDLIENSKSKK